MKQIRAEEEALAPAGARAAAPSMPGGRCALAAALVTVCVSAAACSGGGSSGDATRSGPSGSLGVATQPAADRAVDALCSMLTANPDLAALTDDFQNGAHEELHVIAAATQQRDRTVAGSMLVAKERVEADLAEPSLPDRWRGDVLTLLRRTQDALVAVGLRARSCEADEGYRAGSGD